MNCRTKDMTIDVPPPLADAPLMRDWIAISPGGDVTFLSGRVELGQGNSTDAADDGGR